MSRAALLLLLLLPLLALLLLLLLLLLRVLALLRCRRAHCHARIRQPLTTLPFIRRALMPHIRTVLAAVHDRAIPIGHARASICHTDKLHGWAASTALCTSSPARA